MKRMKYSIIGALLLTAATANAGDMFGAALKPTPAVTLFGQTLTWPIPSLCVGAKAGVTPNADVSADGINFKIPYLAVEIPFPSLLLKAGKDNPSIEVKLGAVNKQDSE
tara:strand:+ start:128 stop:454 length:327 start_codon:yes stop_codon:yes gene_type:complete